MWTGRGVGWGKVRTCSERVHTGSGVPGREPWELRRIPNRRLLATHHFVFLRLQIERPLEGRRVRENGRVQKVHQRLRPFGGGHFPTR